MYIQGLCIQKKLRLDQEQGHTRRGGRGGTGWVKGGEGRPGQGPGPVE